MSSIFDKMRTIGLSNVHSLLDAVINLNDIGALKVHVRDVGDAYQTISDQAAVMKGRGARLDQQIAVIQGQMKTTNDNIDLFLSDTDPSNDHFATTLEQKLMGYESSLKGLQDQKVTVDDDAAKLADAASKLKTKYDELVRRVSQLESMEQTARAKTQAAGAIQNATQLAGNGPDLDNVESRIRDKAAVADSRFDTAMGGMSDSLDDASQAAEAAARIAARRAQLQGTAAPAPADTNSQAA